MKPKNNKQWVVKKLAEYFHRELVQGGDPELSCSLWDILEGYLGKKIMSQVETCQDKLIDKFWDNPPSQAVAQSNAYWNKIVH